MQSYLRSFYQKKSADFWEIAKRSFLQLHVKLFLVFIRPRHLRVAWYILHGTDSNQDVCHFQVDQAPSVEALTMPSGKSYVKYKKSGFNIRFHLTEGLKFYFNLLSGRLFYGPGSFTEGVLSSAANESFDDVFWNCILAHFAPLVLRWTALAVIRDDHWMCCAQGEVAVIEVISCRWLAVDLPGCSTGISKTKTSFS